MSEENRFIKNKKIIVVVALIGIILGTSTGVMVGLYINESKEYNDLSGDYDELYIDYLELLNDFNELTLTQIETLCNADTYVGDMEPDTNFGNEQYWRTGEDEYTWEQFIAFFNFSLSDKPEIYEKVEIQLSLSPYSSISDSIAFPVKYFQEWEESTITYNTMIYPDPIFLSFSLNFNMITYSMKIVIDITDWVNTGINSVSIAVLGGNFEGYSREHPNQDVVPKLIWTIIGVSI